MSNSITESIMGAWDDAEEEEAPAELSEGAEPVVNETAEQDQDEAPSDDTLEEDEEPEEEDSEEPGEEADDDEESSEEDDEEETSGDEELPAAFSDDPQVKAFLARNGGTIESAVRKSMQFEQVLGRQGRELGDLRKVNAELEAELDQARAFQQQGQYLSAEQQGWVEEAAESGNPLGYIQMAVEAGEYDLARAVIDNAELPAGQVIRLSQAIDQAQQNANAPAYEEPAPLNHQALLGVLVEHYPEMPQFESEMVATLAMLGHDHPLAALSRSDDPSEAAQGIIGIYEIARAKTATVTNARDTVKKKRRQDADAVRRDSVVTSAQASPSQKQAARSRSLMPGLTMEALDAEFDAE